MKTRFVHLLTLLVWLVVLAGYVAVLSHLSAAPGLLLTLPAAVGALGAAQEWSDLLDLRKAAKQGA